MSRPSPEEEYREVLLERMASIEEFLLKILLELRSLRNNAEKVVNILSNEQA